MKKSGFTLIELLVVIAIIGILSSVVLSSLNSARTKGADGAAKADLAGVRAQSEIYFDSNGDFGEDFNTNDCSAAGASTMFVLDEVAARQIADAEMKTGNTLTCAAGNGIQPPNGTAATSWAISVPLKGGGTWCISGYAGGEADKTAQINASFAAICQ